MKPLFTIENSELSLFVFPVGNLQVNCTVIKSKATNAATIFDPGDALEDITNIINHLQLKPEVLIHTHAHFDHIGISSVLKQKAPLQLVLHEKDRALYENIAEQAYMFRLKLAPPAQIDNYLSKEKTLITSNDSALNKFFNNLKVLFTPGHSPGSCCFFSTAFDTPILIAGDTLFYQSIGRTDLLGGDFRAIISSIKTELLTLPPETIVICGHGQMTTIKIEKTSNPFII